MPSKGLDVFSYIALPNYEVHFSVPGGSLVRTSEHNFKSAHLEVDKKDIPGRLHFTGRFSWAAVYDGESVASHYVDINSLTGNIENGTMAPTQNQKSVIVDDAIITYGFYDAGHGEAGLTNKDQCYVTIVSKSVHSTWMTTLVPSHSDAEQLPFSRFVLAAPHDDGMNSMTTCNAVLAGKGEEVVHKLCEHVEAVSWLTEHMSHSMAVHMLPNLIYGLAITQKDPIPTLLAFGARYFEFRPAKLLPMFEKAIEHLPNSHYFQHACIPGLAFEDFLEQIVMFLDENPDEFVVTHIRWDNIVGECKKPTSEELDEAYNTAVASAKTTSLRWGDGTCFNESIATLRGDGRRLIRVIEAEKYDSWTKEAYATLHADPIIERFESMNTEGQEGTDITVLQCQATSQSIREVLLYSVISSNADTSCLTSTKADLDRYTLPWIKKNALERLQAEKLLVIMNDFMDGATTDVMIELNKQRFGGSSLPIR